MNPNKLTKDEKIARLARSNAVLESANRTLQSGNNCLRSALREAYWSLPPGAADRLQHRYPQIIGGFIAEQEADEAALQKARDLATVYESAQ